MNRGAEPVLFPHAQEASPSLQGLRPLRTPLRLAEEVGPVLGRGEVLQRTLPAHLQSQGHMKTLRLLLGDQLNAAHPWFDNVSDDVVYLMA